MNTKKPYKLETKIYRSGSGAKLRICATLDLPKGMSVTAESVLREELKRALVAEYMRLVEEIAGQAADRLLFGEDPPRREPIGLLKAAEEGRL